MTQAERLASIETLLKERAIVSERDSKRIADALEKLSGRIDDLEKAVAGHDNVVSWGKGALALVALLAGAAGAFVKTIMSEILK